MVTDRPGIALGIVTADCAPVLFADRAAGGGRRRACRLARRARRRAGGDASRRCAPSAPTARIAAAIGPCIGQDSYEVAADLRDAVLARDPADARFFAPGRRPERWQFDLPGYCAARLAAAGVAAIEVLGADTLADADRFFSHRRRTLAGGGPIGHQISDHPAADLDAPPCPT